MYKFKGTINGVEYTDKKAFYEALKKFQNSNERVKVSFQEQTEKKPGLPAAPQNSAAVQTTAGYEEMFQRLFGSLFLSFLKAENPNKYNRLVQAVKEKNLNAPQRKEPVNKGLSCTRIQEKYFFPETTYQFKGNSEDEFHLDRFSGLLKTREEEIRRENFGNLVQPQLQLLYRTACKEHSRVKREAERMAQMMGKIDITIAKYEGIVKAYNAASLPTPEEIEKGYANARTEFDRLTNKRNYYLLLEDYYRTIGPAFDR